MQYSKSLLFTLSALYFGLLTSLNPFDSVLQHFRLPPGCLYMLKLLTARCLPSGFPGSSAGKESACNAGEPGSIPGLGRSSGERISFPPQFSWVSLLAHTEKSTPAMQETWLQSLGWEASLEEGMATHSSILAWRIPLDRGAWQATVHGVAKSWM